MAQIAGQSGTVWEVDSASKAGRVLLYDAYGNPIVYAENDQPDTPRGVLGMGLNDRSVLPFRVDRFGSQAVALHTPLLTESFEGATINPIRWTAIATTMAATQASATGLVLNSGNITTVSTGYLLKSNRAYLKSMRQPLHGKFRAKMFAQNNSVQELGFGDATTFNGAHTNGSYWQCAANGVIQPVVSFNGASITGYDIRSLLDTSKFYVWDVFMDDDEAIFTVQDTSTGLMLSRQSIKVPRTGVRMWGTTQINSFARCYNTASAPSAAAQLVVADVYVALLDGNLNLPYPHVKASQHRDALKNPFSGAQLAQFANSAEPASATLSNTAAGYTTLGGKFQFAAIAGAATDYALFGFQVPSPATLMITGIDIEAWNTGAAVATTPTLLTWGIATDLTAVSLATGGHARVGLGAQCLAVGAVIGATADRRISKTFQTPLVTGPGRYVDIILSMPIAKATASQVIAGMVNIEGYFL